MVWTVSGGFATLVDAQTRAGIPGGINWGGLSLAGQETILRFDGDDTDTVAPAVLGGANHNQIVLDLETQKAGVSGSANFKLTYNPLGVNTGEGTSLWIIRNGVNDEAQNSKTTFARDSNGKILWKGTTADKENGNGAVAFEFVDDVISNVDLTKLVPAPVTGKMPVTGAFDEGTYTGIVEWKAVVGGTSKPRFEGETVYMATVTNLAAKDGFSFSPEFTVTHSGSSGILHTPGDAAEAKVLFPKTGFWEYDGPFSGIDYDPLNMDSAIDIIRLAKEESWNSLSLKLLPWQETVDIRASGTDIGKEEGLKLTATNSPAAVILDGGGKTIPLTAGNTGSVITVGVGVTLTLQNITFQGLGTNTAPLIKVDGGTLVLENGAVITGNGNTNTNTGVTVNGGGVYMDGGTFTMSGGVISGSAKYAGGVYVNGGTFTMSGGVINGNARHSGGGVYMTGSSKFNMSGGTIKGETTDIFSSMGGGVYMNGGEFTMEGTAIISGKSGGDVGGGVYMTGSSKFNMSGGEISNSNAGSNSDGGGVYMTGSEFTMSGGKISNNTARGGGGVFMVNNSTFMMTGGKISDNTATTTTGGGMIVGSSSTFTMISGAISGNTASGSGGGVVVSGTFTKTKGIIYGDVGDPRGNTAGGSGHAVYVDNGGKKRDSTADATISLDSTKFSDEGGWEE
jgi:hypothetical protein